MKTLQRMILIVVVLSSGITEADSIKPYDLCEQTAIAEGKNYKFNVRTSRYEEVNEELRACETDTDCEELERALDEIEAAQE